MKPGPLKHIVFLTGAGISAESGIRTFRDSDGLWEQHRIEDVATPEAYARDPQLVWRFYSMRRIHAAKAQPNLGHKSLVDFAAGHLDVECHLITQNVDGLHHRADPAHRLAPLCMHGSLHESRCTNCGMVYFDDYAYFDLEGNYAPQETGLCFDYEKASTSWLHHYKLEYRNFLPQSPCCNQPVRPNIVWFGEVPLLMDKIGPLLKSCELFVTIGTSGLVYPAAGFLQIAKHAGARTVCLNKELIPQTMYVDEFRQGLASEEVPKFLAELAASRK